MTENVLKKFGPHAVFHCPACEEEHLLPLDQGWKFNGDWERPTFNPSFRLSKHSGVTQCHFFVRNGAVQFCNDCPHELAGETVKLEPV